MVDTKLDHARNTLHSRIRELQQMYNLSEVETIQLLQEYALRRTKLLKSEKDKE